ncbi:MAG: hypothetical protein WBW25_05035, partial [Halobacteriota archaeon]
FTGLLNETQKSSPIFYITTLKTHLRVTRSLLDILAHDVQETKDPLVFASSSMFKHAIHCN